MQGSEHGAEPTPEIPIDAGVRAWYRACPCCLSQTHPNVKRLLDDERRRARDERRAAAGHTTEDRDA